MRDIERGFRIDDRLIGWGTTMARAAALVGADAADLPRIGYCTLRTACRDAWGFRTLAAELTGNGASRPVTGLAWELAPPDGDVTDTAFWSRQLEHRLGPPDHVSVDDAATDSGSVRYYANWDGREVSVGLSIYAALREISEGLSAGTLWLTWSTERAAEPFMAEWRSACSSLEVAAREADPLTVFSVSLDQHPLYGGAGGGPKSGARARREASLALAAPDVLLTPPPVARRLSKTCFALWSNRRLKVHCLSTRWDSVIWDEGAQRNIDWWHVLPARGAGQSALHVGRWSVVDVTHSPGVAAAAAALEAIPGVAINRVEGYDC